MYTHCINTNQQTNGIFYDNFVCLQVIVHWVHEKSKLKSATPRNTCRNLSFWILLCILKRHPVVVWAVFIFVKYVKLIYSREQFIRLVTVNVIFAACQIFKDGRQFIHIYGEQQGTYDGALGYPVGDLFHGWPLRSYRYILGSESQVVFDPESGFRPKVVQSQFEIQGLMRDAVKGCRFVHSHECHYFVEVGHL